MHLYQDKGVNGRQFDAGEVGRLDILGTDSHNNIVVIELKTGKAELAVPFPRGVTGVTSSQDLNQLS